MTKLEVLAKKQKLDRIIKVYRAKIADLKKKRNAIIAEFREAVKEYKIKEMKKFIENL